MNGKIIRFSTVVWTTRENNIEEVSYIAEVQEISSDNKSAEILVLGHLPNNNAIYMPQKSIGDFEQVQVQDLKPHKYDGE